MNKEKKNVHIMEYYSVLKKKEISWVRWHTPVIPNWQEDGEFETSLVFIGRTGLRKEKKKRRRKSPYIQHG
jgi:hypothetical protein